MDLFGMIDIGNVGNKVNPNPLVVSDLQNLPNNAQEVQNVYNRVISDTISKEIEGLIYKDLY